MALGYMFPPQHLKKSWKQRASYCDSSGGMPSATFAIFGEDITYLCLERDVNGRQSTQSTQARGSQSFQVALDLYERVFSQHPHEVIHR